MTWLVPRRFLRHLQHVELLKSDLRGFVRSCRRPARASLRINQLKTTNEKAVRVELEKFGWNLEAVKWCSSGWFLSMKDPTRKHFFAVGRSLPHFLGHIYSQEAASMLAVEVLKSLLKSPINDSLLVLDLCAAPGGKAIQLADALKETKAKGFIKCCLKESIDLYTELIHSISSGLELHHFLCSSHL